MLDASGPDVLCGGRGIRTLEELSPLTVFKTAAFNHSAIPPDVFLCTDCLPRELDPVMRIVSEKYFFSNYDRLIA